MCYGHLFIDPVNTNIILMALKTGLADIARRFREKYGKEMPTHKLARIMHKAHPLDFNDIEHARTSLRYIENKQGGRQKRPASEFTMEEARPMNPYSLPESYAVDILPYCISGKQYKRGLIINDTHHPYHSIEAITLCLNYAKKEKPDFILLNGDIIDCHLLSKYTKDPESRKFKEELDQLRSFIQTLQRVFKCKIFYKLGNHEIRYQHFLWEKAKELVGIDEFKITEILKARTEGVEIIEDKRIVMLNDLPVLHGHEFGSSVFSPVNQARGLWLKASESCLQGHGHITSENTKKTARGQLRITWSVGCLCHLQPQWKPMNDWNWGFAMIDLDAKGVDYIVRNKRIYKGEVK